MASAADMLTAAVADGLDAVFDPKRYRKLLRRCIARTPEDAPTKWAKPPRRPRISLRQALVVASVQIIALMGLMRWLGYYDWAPQAWINAAFVVAATPILADTVVRVGRWRARRRHAASRSPRADGRMRYRPITRPPTRRADP